MIFRKLFLGKVEDFIVYIKNFIRFFKFNFFKYVGFGYWGFLVGFFGGCVWVYVYGVYVIVFVYELLVMLGFFFFAGGEVEFCFFFVVGC